MTPAPSIEACRVVGIASIPWRRIRPLAGQPREYFDKAALAELATSIGAIGQCVPAQVARIDGDKSHDFELIDGQRRWHAVQIAGVETLRCEVIDEPDEDRRYLRSVLANFSRQPNHSIEIAVAIDRIRKGRTIEQVADILGKSRSYVEQHLLLLRLHPDLKAAMHPSVPKGRRRLPLAAAIMLAKRDPGEQIAAWEEIRRHPDSLLRATKLVVDALPVDDRRPKKEGSPYEKYRSLKNMLNRTASDLEAITAEQFEHLTQGRASEDRQQMVQSMERIAARLEWMRAALPGVRWEGETARQSIRRAAP
jgi:ParB/RepB/Spo0J family partition protein